MNKDLRVPQMLIQARTVKQLSGGAIAAQIFTSESSYRKWEVGTAPLPSWMAKKVSEVLSINRIELVNAMASDYKFRMFKQMEKV